jgi:L,D-transpeptidase YcbB
MNPAARGWRIAAVAMLVGLLACALGIARAFATSGARSPGQDVAGAIGLMLTAGWDANSRPFSNVERGQLNTLYEPGGHRPIWVDESGRPSRDARAALALLSDAAGEGLDPVDYTARAIEGQMAALETGRGQPQDIAAFDLALSVNTLRYLRGLHAGRIDPRAIGFRLAARVDDHDFASLLREALTRHRIDELATELTPPLALYRGLRGMLARYRALAARDTIEPLPRFSATVRPGDVSAELVGPLHQRLVALGDLPADAPVAADGAGYAGALVEGMKHFQLRHGLQADGVIGRDTQAALQVPLEWRVRQIELALERLRWLPHLGENRFLAVNIPMFQVWGWDLIPANGAPSFGMGVIVGRALNTQTPVFVEEMRYVIFRPYWNIPPSILRHEILPALQRDADYLARHQMEIVSGQGDDARPVRSNAESIARLRQGTYRVRQRPGPTNALGLVKFVFPNDANVYLHGTPAPQLFRQSRRDFSHGCVRVEDPVALAEWALKDQPEWDRDRILEAMHANQPRRVNLTRPIQVILFYVTAVVMPEDGTLRFADDIYGHDVRLDRALSHRPPPFAGSETPSPSSR